MGRHVSRGAFVLEMPVVVPEGRATQRDGRLLSPGSGGVEPWPNTLLLGNGRHEAGVGIQFGRRGGGLGRAHAEEEKNREQPPSARARARDTRSIDHASVVLMYRRCLGGRKPRVGSARNTPDRAVWEQKPCPSRTLLAGRGSISKGPMHPHVDERAQEQLSLCDLPRDAGRYFIAASPFIELPAGPSRALRHCLETGL